MSAAEPPTRAARDDGRATTGGVSDPAGGDAAAAATVRRRRVRRACTLLVAASLPVVLLLIAGAAGLPLIVGQGPTTMSIGLGSVVIASLVAGAAAWGLLALLERLARRGRRAWLVIAWIVLAASTLGPLSMAASPGAAAVLIVMHLVVGVTLIVGLAGRPRRGSSPGITPTGYPAPT